ncbi:MAG: lysophospholipid acyltransferase family protein, partial [Vicinamibacterales bacterium]
WMGLSVSGIRLDVVGKEHILVGRAAVYAANHGSSIEPPVVFFALKALFPHLSVLYKAELRKLPVLVWVFDAAGFVPLERANRGQSLPAVDRAAKTLIAGRSFLIFPEGTRSRTGHMLPFKKGGFVMAIQAQVPVVPVAVSGSSDALKRGSMVIRSGSIRVEFAPPIPTTGMTFADRSDLAETVRAAIASRMPEAT